MFDRIADRYDLVNTVLSAGGDQAWRRQAARKAAPPAGGAALDIACGSGRLTAELARLIGPTGITIGLDFSLPMLTVAGRHASGGHFVQGDALALPFPAAFFDTCTNAFGLRNLADPVQGLMEMVRVLRPGGRAVVLEFVRPPRNLVGWAYRLYLTRILPVVGGRLSGDPAAYRYLSSTVDSYRTPEELRELARQAGWGGVELRLLNLGTVAVLSGTRA